MQKSESSGQKTPTITGPGKLEEPVCAVQADGRIPEETDLPFQTEGPVQIEPNKSRQNSIVERCNEEIEEVGYVAGRLALFINEWKKITTDSFIISYVKGYAIPFKQTPVPHKSPEQQIWKKGESEQINIEIQKLIQKNAIEKCQECKDQFISPIFLVQKPDGSNRFILNLRLLNKFIEPPHFKMEDIRSVKNLLTPKAFMASIDLKDAYFSVPVHEASRKYLRFIFKGEIYQFRCLPFGLCTSPYVFTKIMKPVINALRARGFLSIVYLDDILLIGKKFNECKENALESKYFLEKLGFIINKEKSVLIPSQKRKFLGFIFNSIDYTIELTNKKKNQIKYFIEKLVVGKEYKIRDFAQLLGVLNAACPAVAYGLVHCKKLEREKYLALITNEGNYEDKMKIKLKLREDIEWWKRNSQIGVNPIRTSNYEIDISSDASLTGWGAHCNDQSANGWWNSEEKKRHINYLELLAAFTALKCFASHLRKCEVLLRLDNTTAIAYVNKAGGIRFPILNELARQIWLWCEDRELYVYASYVASKQNVLAYVASRITNIDTEWELSQKAYERINRKFGPFSIDLFATYSNRKVVKFCSRYPNPEVFRVDAFTISWKNEKPYAFPPFALILPTLKKISN